MPRMWTKDELNVVWLAALHIEMGLSIVDTVCKQLSDLMKHRTYDSIRKKIYVTRKELNIPEDVKEQLNNVWQLTKLYKEYQNAIENFHPELLPYGFKFTEYATKEELEELQKKLSETCNDPNYVIRESHSIDLNLLPPVDPRHVVSGINMMKFHDIDYVSIMPSFMPESKVFVISGLMSNVFTFNREER